MDHTKPISSSSMTPAACDAVTTAMRQHYPKAFKSMRDLVSCGLAELRMFQALVHVGLIQEVADYAKYCTPVYACNTDDDGDVLYEELAHDALEADMTTDDPAADLGVDSIEHGITARMKTIADKVLKFTAVVAKYDTPSDQKKIACQASMGVEYNEKNDREYCFYSCECRVTVCSQGEGVHSEEEAVTTEEEETDDDDSESDSDEDFVPSSEVSTIHMQQCSLHTPSPSTTFLTRDA